MDQHTDEDERKESATEPVPWTDDHPGSWPHPSDVIEESMLIPADVIWDLMYSKIWGQSVLPVSGASETEKDPGSAK